MTQSAIMPEWMQARLAGTVQSPGEIEIAPDEVGAFTLFVSLDTQWRWCALSGHRLGLDYGVIPHAAAMQGTEMTPVLFRDLRVMERAALDALAERQRK
jgi:hypothetical protein